MSLATALILAVQGCFETYAESLKMHQGNPVAGSIAHVLVGDGIATNEFAAKVLLRYFRNNMLGSIPIDYLLFLVKCATHKCNLIVAIVVSFCPWRLRGTW